ncbi:MAG: FxLYD domain-containing protein [Clostridioides sp.]|jgi:RNA polymerase subunit RPABC4/transcription elongation factor Spt4|nr:FxLYD domain-containing protein [Clostridioides sp.]
MAKMKECQACGKEMSASAKACPNCGHKNKKPIYKKPWFIVLAIIVVIGIASKIGNGGTSTTASTAGTSTKATSETKKEEPKKEKYEIVGEITSETNALGGVDLSGKIKNNSGKDAKYVQVTFNLYDKDNNQLGTALANVNNLKAEGNWKFKAIGTATGDVDHYELAEVSGF